MNKNAPSALELRQKLVQKAGNATLILANQLSILLDAYDFFVLRYPADNQRAFLELDDLKVSINALGSLPHQVRVTIATWADGDEPPLSAIGFELHVLNEFYLHMDSVARFMSNKHIDMDAFHPAMVLQSFELLRSVNRVIGQLPIR